MTETNIIERHIMQVMSESIIPPFGYVEYLEMKTNWITTDYYPSGDDLLSIIMMGNHYGAVLRTTYLKTVHRCKYDARNFWNVVIKVFILAGSWVDSFRELLKTKEAKEIISKLQHPKWVEVGLCGCDWKKLRAMCEKFCEWYDSLPEGVED